jgi:defect-in-organelle-trafficking protein DotA
MLALGVFLRPVLMVIGYLSAIILSYIGFAIVNFSFGQVLVSSFTASSGSASSTDLGMNALPAIWTVVNGSPSSSHGSHFTGPDLSDVLLSPLLMIGYGLILIEVVNQCFSLVHVLPDMVLRWIGGPVQQDMSERYASQVQSGLSGSAKQGGQVAGQGATGFGGAMGGMVVQPAVEHVANSGLTASADSLSSGGSGGSAGAEGGEGGADALALMA